MMMARRKKSHLLRRSDFSDSQHLTCMPMILKNHYALYMEPFATPSILKNSIIQRSGYV